MVLNTGDLRTAQLRRHPSSSLHSMGIKIKDCPPEISIYFCCRGKKLKRNLNKILSRIFPVLEVGANVKQTIDGLLSAKEQSRPLLPTALLNGPYWGKNHFFSSRDCPYRHAPQKTKVTLFCQFEPSR